MKRVLELKERVLEEEESEHAHEGFFFSFWKEGFQKR